MHELVLCVVSSKLSETVKLWKSGLIYESPLGFQETWRTDRRLVKNTRNPEHLVKRGGCSLNSLWAHGCIGGRASGRALWALLLPILEDWLVWSCTGDLAAEGSWVQCPHYVQKMPLHSVFSLTEYFFLVSHILCSRYLHSNTLLKGAHLHPLDWSPSIALLAVSSVCVSLLLCFDFT